MTGWQVLGSWAKREVTQASWCSSRGPADDFLPYWDPHWPPLMKMRSQLHSSGSVRVRREVLSSTFSHFREYQTPGNLVPTLCVSRHLGISCAAVIRLPYIIGVTIFFLCSFLVVIVLLYLSIFPLNFHLFHMHSIAVHTWPHAQSCRSYTASSAVLLFTHSLMHSLIHSHTP